jgi:hypothetical protein
MADLIPAWMYKQMYERACDDNSLLSRKIAVYDGCLDMIYGALDVAGIARDAETAEDVDDAERAMADLMRGGRTEHTFA